MWNEVIESILKKIVARYPRLEREELVFARITAKTVENEKYSYNIKVLTRYKEPDNCYPELTKILAKTEYSVGQIVIVALLYGQEGYILGECYD